jgi:hypothetical protein
MGFRRPTMGEGLSAWEMSQEDKSSPKSPTHMGSHRPKWFPNLGHDSEPRATMRAHALLGLGFLSRPTPGIFLRNLSGVWSLTGGQSHRAPGPARTLFPRSCEAVLDTSNIGSRPGHDTTRQRTNARPPRSGPAWSSHSLWGQTLGMRRMPREGKAGEGSKALDSI